MGVFGSGLGGSPPYPPNLDCCQKVEGAQPPNSPGVSSSGQAHPCPFLPTYGTQPSSGEAGPHLVGELDVGWRVAQLPVDVHLDTPREGCLCGLNGTHDAGWATGRVGTLFKAHPRPRHTRVLPLHLPGPRPRAVHSPGRHGVPFWLKGAVLASHSDPLDVIRSDSQI